VPAAQSRILLAGVLDVAVQQEGRLVYRRTWAWTDAANVEGRLPSAKTPSRPETSCAATRLSATSLATRSGARSVTPRQRATNRSRAVQQVTEVHGESDTSGRWFYFRDAASNIFELKDRR
jgi:hypothetical protein